MLIAVDTARRHLNANGGVPLANGREHLLALGKRPTGRAPGTVMAPLETHGDTITSSVATERSRAQTPVIQTGAKPRTVYRSRKRTFETG